MQAKKLLSSRQIFRYAVPARTVTKKALCVTSEVTTFDGIVEMCVLIIILYYCNYERGNLCKIFLCLSV